MRATRLLLAFALLASASAFAQTTPWGDPDLQGVWSNLTPVPLERPAALADKPFFTPAEAAEAEKNALAATLKRVEAETATSGEFRCCSSASPRTPAHAPSGNRTLASGPPHSKAKLRQAGLS